MKILVTGGLGFIGSHTCVELINKNHKIVIADNLSNSSIETLEKINKITGVIPDFHQIDVTEEFKLEQIFNKYNFDGVIHFAGYKAVGESVEKPLDYYYNNLVSTIKLSEMCLKYNVDKFVFSSSATVYGDDYDTVDGTGVRDYIHVVDLAEGHVAALENLESGVNIYNLGTGKGTSVFQIVNAFTQVNGVEIPYQIVGRRQGDIAISYADTEKAEKELNWKAKRDIKDMVRDSWRFELN